jgi:hypothetical protein
MITSCREKAKQKPSEDLLSLRIDSLSQRQLALDASLKDYKMQSSSFATASVQPEKNNNQMLALEQQRCLANRRGMNGSGRIGL